jgi:hypothetical protein
VINNQLAADAIIAVTALPGRRPAIRTALM